MCTSNQYVVRFEVGKEASVVELNYVPKLHQHRYSIFLLLATSVLSSRPLDIGERKTRCDSNFNINNIRYMEGVSEVGNKKASDEKHW
jgi:hypothetical protein